MPSLAVILPAAGSSTRFGGPRNKLFSLLAGEAVVAHSLRAFDRRDDVAMIVVPARRDDGAGGGAEFALPGSLAGSPKLQFCAGGASRARSVYNALREVPASVEWVAVHDAARPLVSQGLIDRTLAAARLYGAAVPAMAVQLTVKQAAGPLPAQVVRTVPRHELWAMQTPQVMRRADLLGAFAACPLPLEQVTDDVQLLELAGLDVWLVPGEERNLKITTQSDLILAELLLKQQAGPASTLGPSL